MRKILWIGCLSYLLIGLAHVVLGSVLEELIKHYGLDYSKGSQLIFNQFAGFLVGVLSTPWILSRLGRKNTLLFALICLTTAETVYSFLPPWGWMLTAAPVAGFGFGIVETAIGALIIQFVVDKKAVAMSRLEVFFGLGALLMPAIASLLIYFGHWQWTFPLVAGFSLATLALWALTPFGKSNELLIVHKKPAAENGNIDRRYNRQSLPVLILMMLFFLIYVGIEMSFVHFLPSILMDNVGASPATATMGITAFWTTVVIGRLFSGHLGERLGYGRYLIISSIGMLAFLTMFSFTSELWLSFIVILLMGFMAAGIFAIGLIYANHHIPGMTERTTSLLVASGGIGGALIPRFIGWTMDELPLRLTLSLLIALTAVLVLLLLIANSRKKAI